MTTSSKRSALVPVILSGGMGTRLWPLSRQTKPKQFLSLNTPESSLIQETAARINTSDLFEAPLMICNARHQALIEDHMKAMGIDDFTTVLEPCGRNTAPALACAAAHVAANYDDAYMLVLPADHIIEEPEQFLDAVEAGLALAEQGHIITFGIEPNAPETGFGYIQYGDTLGDRGYTVQQFVEKPALDKAKEYVASGQYAWNAGIFLFSARTYLEELSRFEPEMAQLSRDAYTNKTERDGAYLLDEALFSQVKDESIDYAVMEHTDKAAVVPMSCGWNDAGSWETLWKIKNKDAHGNVLIGQSFMHDTHNCYINSSEGPTVATIGLEDITIVSTPDCVMVAKTDRAQDVKKMVNILKEANPKLVDNHE